MSDLHLPPLPPDQSRLFDIERSLEPADPALQASIWNRVERAVLFPGPGDGGIDGGGGGLGAEASLASGAASAALRKLVIVGATAFAAGGLTGGLVTSELLTPSPLVIEGGASPAMVATAMAAPASEASPKKSAALTEPEAIDEPAPGAVRDSPAPSPAGPLPASPSDTSSLATLDREREVLDIAKSALRRKLADVAFDAIDRHAAQFPEGQLSEEREALRVQALVLAGRTGEAAEKAAAFKERYEDSLLLPSVEQSIASDTEP
jgi:hypothetical protein